MKPNGMYLCLINVVLMVLFAFVASCSDVMAVSPPDFVKTLTIMAIINVTGVVIVNCLWRLINQLVLVIQHMEEIKKQLPPK